MVDGIARPANEQESTEIEARNNEWVAGALERSKVEAYATINDKCDQLIGQLVVSYPKYEVETFSKQELQARAYLANGAASTPMLDYIASQRGLTRGQLASKIMAKVTVFETIAGNAVGYRQRLESAVNSASTVDEIIALDLTNNWPE